MAEMYEVTTIPFDSIELGGNGFANSRATQDSPALEELKSSIAKYGLIDPLVVWAGEVSDDDSGEDRNALILICGYRRYAAIASIRREDAEKFKEVPVTVVYGSLNDVMTMNFEENNKREELNPADEAQHVYRMVLSLGDQNSVAAALSKSQSWVSQSVALVRYLCVHAMHAYRTGDINRTKALKLAALRNESGDGPDDVKQMELLDIMLGKAEKPDAPQRKRRKDTELANLIDSERDSLEDWFDGSLEAAYRLGALNGLRYSMGMVTEEYFEAGSEIARAASGSWGSATAPEADTDEEEKDYQDDDEEGTHEGREQN